MKKHFLLTTLVILFAGCLNNLWAQLLPQNITISVPRGDDGGFVTMELEKYSIRDPNFCKYYIDNQNYEVGENGTAKAANPLNFDEETLNDTDYPVRTYRGHVAEEPNSTVVAFIWPGNDKLTAYVNEGVRYLWDLEELPIDLDIANGTATVSVSESAAYAYSSINGKSSGWTPTFGNTPPPAPVAGSGPVANGNSPHGWSLIPSAGFTKMQIAIDAQPEAAGSLTDAELFASIEHGINMLDLQFARDLGIQYRLTGVVRRMDTDALAGSGDARTIWTDLGLMDNPGASNTTANSIPAQQIVYRQTGEGNPVAYQSQKPLNGGNYARVNVGSGDNGGFMHEVSHNWGGAHFVYPNDIMSGGGSWFGPTTNQRHIYVKNNPNVTTGLPIATNAEYGWNVHPYATPDLVKMFVNETATIEVLKNDFDSNGDDVRISTFDATTPKGGTVTMSNGNLVYTPAADFIGRDEFNYIISDGELFNTTWVQVDVSNGSLEMHYTFEESGSTIQDQSGANLHGESVNFTATVGTGLNGTNAWEFPDLGGINTDNDNERAFLSFGDVIDPMDGSHSVSVWFKIDPLVLTGNYNCHIVSNSSTAINKLISGYNIFIDKNSKRLTFEALEQLTTDDGSIAGTQLDIIGDVVTADTWIHTVLVFDRKKNEMRAYMDGNQVGNTLSLQEGGMIKGKPNGDRYTSGALGICTYKPKKFTPFIGLMDEFRVYGRPITPAEIDTLHTNPTGTIDKDQLVFTQIPTDINLGCGESTLPSNTGEVLAYSPCYPAINISYHDAVAANDNITRTWTVMDGCDGPLTHVQQINFVDALAPIADQNTLDDINANCIISTISAPTATDACDGEITGVADVNFPVTAEGTTQITWTFTDAVGNTANQTQNIIIASQSAALPINEDMESFTFTGTKDGCNPSATLGGGLRNVNNSEFANDNTNWRVNSGTGISSSSGPLVDYTEGTNTGQYLYLRGSSGCGQKTGAIITDCLDFMEINTPILKFAYQAIKTNNVATPELHVDVLSDGVWTENVYEVLGEQGARNGDQADWTVHEVGLNAFSGKIVNIRIWGTSSTNGVNCDLALDGIEVYDGNPCSALKDLTGSESSNPMHIVAEKIESNQAIEIGANVQYDAKDYILLKEGFSVEAGADFHAFIQGCTNNALQEGASRNSSKKKALGSQDITKKYVKVFPNPLFSGQSLFFETDSDLPFQFELFSVVGQQIISQVVVDNQSIQLPALAGGIYFYKIGNQEIGKNGQLVIQN